MSEIVVAFDKPLPLSAWLDIRGLSNQTFAKAIGVSPSAVSKWKAGKSAPSVAIIPKIEEALQTDWKTIVLSSKGL